MPNPIALLLAELVCEYLFHTDHKEVPSGLRELLDRFVRETFVSETECNRLIQAHAQAQEQANNAGS